MEFAWCVPPIHGWLLEKSHVLGKEVVDDERCITVKSTFPISPKYHHQRTKLTVSWDWNRYSKILRKIRDRQSKQQNVKKTNHVLTTLQNFQEIFEQCQALNIIYKSLGKNQQWCLVYRVNILLHTSIQFSECINGMVNNFCRILKEETIFAWWAGSINLLQLALFCKLRQFIVKHKLQRLTELWSNMYQGINYLNS